MKMHELDSNMKRLCSICARGGSKGVKNKNIRNLAGKPLIAYSIEQAKASGLFEYVAVSSDSPQILEVARQFGVDFLIERPAELATDRAAKIPVIRHCFEQVEKLTGETFEVLVDLDATSPLRSVDDIRAAVALLETRNVSNVITGTPARRSPYFNLVEADANGVVGLAKKLEKAIERRQDAPQCYDMNASIYVWRRDVLLQSDVLFQSDTLLHEMPEERSVDIDSELDFEWVEYLMTKKEGRA